MERAWSIAAVLSLLIVLSPLAAASEQVTVGDDDLTFALAVAQHGAAAPFGALCFVDDDGSASYDPGEPVYAVQASDCSGSVAGNDLRLIPNAGQPAGSQVRATHSDFGASYTAFSNTPSVDHRDADADGVYSRGDTVYVDADASVSVSAGDVRLSGTDAGTAVQSGDADEGLALTGAAPAGFSVTSWDFLDADGDLIWDSGDTAYLDGDQDGLATAVDVRLGSVVGEGYGGQLQINASDLTYTLAGSNPFGALCFVDDDGSAAYEVGEPVYAVTASDCSGSVASNDVRLVPTAGQPAGSQVLASHSDFGDSYTAFSSSPVVDFFDGNGDGVYSLGDKVYADLDASADVSTGDVRLSGSSAGEAVQSSDSDVGNALSGAPPTGFSVTSWVFLDADADAFWTTGDKAYLDADQDGFATTGDVRLGSVGGEAYGGQLEVNAADLTYALEGSGPFAAMCFVDEDGSASYNPGEPVYATGSSCSGSVQANDLRLTPAAGNDEGTQVLASDSDFGNPYTAFSTTPVVDYFDADGDGVYSRGDPVYVDIGATGSVSVGDLRLTGTGDGVTVTSEDSDLNNALSGAPPAAFSVGSWVFHDADGDAIWTTGDTAYVDAQQDALATAVDIRLEPAPNATNATNLTDVWLLNGNANTSVGTDFLGTTDAEPLELKVNGTRALRIEPAPTPNLEGGNASNDVDASVKGGAIAGGGTGSLPQVVTGDFASVDGGLGNAANGFASNVDGGNQNTADAAVATAGGGRDNDARGFASTVAGGRNNDANKALSTASGGRGNVVGGYAGTVSGGFDNFAGDAISTVGGGKLNLATGWKSTIGGGFGNDASGIASTIAGGDDNAAGGQAATVPGGQANTAGGDNSFAAGSGANATHVGAFVWADSTSTSQDSVRSPAADTFSVQAAGGLWLGTNEDPVVEAGQFINTSTNAFLSAGGTWTDASSKAWKEDQRPVEGKVVLEKVKQLPISEWTYKTTPEDVRHMGPMAEDFHAAFGLGVDDQHIASLDSTGVALAAIQGLAEENEQLSQENDALREDVTVLERENDALRENVTELEQENQQLEQRLEAIETELGIGGSADRSGR